MAEKRTKIQAHLPSGWLQEIDELLAQKFPGKKRSDWFRDVVELELAKQKAGRKREAWVDQLLAHDEEMLTLLREVHQATVKS